MYVSVSIAMTNCPHNASNSIVACPFHPHNNRHNQNPLENAKQSRIVVEQWQLLDWEELGQEWEDQNPPQYHSWWTQHPYHLLNWLHLHHLKDDEYLLLTFQRVILILINC